MAFDEAGVRQLVRGVTGIDVLGVLGFGDEWGQQISREESSRSGSGADGSAGKGVAADAFPTATAAVAATATAAAGGVLAVVGKGKRLLQRVEDSDRVKRLEALVASLVQTPLRRKSPFR